jgi:hypothetical protein
VAKVERGREIPATATATALAALAALATIATFAAALSFPTITRLLRNATNGVQPHLITYLPTLFDANLSTPSKSASMPWFVEIANVHGNGAKMIRADGAVVEAQVLGK